MGRGTLEKRSGFAQNCTAFDPCQFSSVENQRIHTLRPPEIHAAFLLFCFVVFLCSIFLSFSLFEFISHSHPFNFEIIRKPQGVGRQFISRWSGQPQKHVSLLIWDLRFLAEKLLKSEGRKLRCFRYELRH